MAEALGQLDQGKLDLPIGTRLEKMVFKRTREVSCWLTQNISGHGCFRCYLFKYSHDDDLRCPECGVDETMEYMVFDCPRFIGPRKRFQREIRTPELLGRKLLEDALFWRGMSSFPATIMKELRRLERNRAEARL